MATTTTNRIRASERRELEQELRRRVSGEVRFDPFSRVLYSTDASIYQMEPVGVVIPRSAADVQATIEVAKENGVPVLPRAGGTSLAGQTVNHAIVMDFSKYMNQVVEVNRDEHWARVQPGIVLDQLNRELLPYGLMYAPDPTTSSRACVGGGIGNNTCGAHSVIYGKSLDHIWSWTYCSPTPAPPTSGRWTAPSWKPSSAGRAWSPRSTGESGGWRRTTTQPSGRSTPASCGGSAATTWTSS